MDVDNKYEKKSYVYERKSVIVFENFYFILLLYVGYVFFILLLFILHGPSAGSSCIHDCMSV